METKREHLINTPHCNKRSERGNALIYVLIAVALFAALSFTLGRQTDTEEVEILSEEKADLYATQLISYATQAKSVVDQMMFIGGRISDLDFTRPSEAGFNTAPHGNKVLHPEGGGLSLASLPSGVVAQSTSDPVPGWYIGRFNNVEWTASSNQDVILVAYQISQAVCEKINEKITGSSAIPTMTDSIKDVMIDDTYHTGTNTDLTTDSGDICPDCENIGSLCVENQAQDAYGFYTLIADE